jgi:dTDP-4-dehydrorhamnose 3,5-epimerase
MNVTGCLLIYANPFYDFRGEFYQLVDSDSFDFFFNKKVNRYFQQNIVTSNEPFTFRGLHSQTKPFEQGKLVSCMNGMIIDVVLDLRKDSESYLSVDYIVLSSENPSVLYVPPGCFHGYLTLRENTVVSYFVDNYYRSDAEMIISPESLEIFKFIDFGRIKINKRDLGIIEEVKK